MTKKILNLSDKIVVGTRGLLESPFLALCISHVITSWTMLESNIAMMFVMLLIGDQDSQTPMAVYHEFFDQGQRNKVFMAIAKRRLSQQLQGELQDFFIKVRKASKMRNDAAHGLWCYSPDFPDYLLIASVSDITDEVAKLIAGKIKDSSVELLRPQLTGKTLVGYKKSDFDQAIVNIANLATKSQQLAMKIVQERILLGPEPSFPEAKPRSPKRGHH